MAVTDKCQFLCAGFVENILPKSRLVVCCHLLESEIIVFVFLFFCCVIHLDGDVVLRIAATTRTVEPEVATRLHKADADRILFGCQETDESVTQPMLHLTEYYLLLRSHQ